MLYEQYRSKIAKVADALGVLRKYRILIICVCAFIAALTATLLSVSGTVYDRAQCPSEITAGEELPYRAGSIFNSVEYEFCVSGSDIWTAEMPARPGEYLVRSYSRDIAGNPRYGKAHSFTILPRTVTVTADCASVVYGELPPVKADLLYSDSVTCSAFTYSDYSSAQTTVEPVAEAVTVYDEKGNDVTYTYIIQTQSSQMDFIKREISVSLSPYTADYDGKEHPKIPYTGYEISGETPLAEGDFEEVYVSVFQTQAGEYANDIYFKIYKKTENGNVEVTSNYDIKVSSGTLTVNKRTLEITTADFEAVYDGLEKYEKGFTLAESSLSALNDAGHSISVAGNTVEKNAGEYENVLEFIITDENGNDVTSNYTLNITYGSLKILPRPLTCSTTSAEWYYDGTAHSDNTGFVVLKNSSSSYASEDEIAYFIEGSQMYVKDVADSCDNMLEIGVYNTALGEDVTGNYAINYIYGELNVMPRPIKVTVDGEEWEYDGKAHSSNKHTISYNKNLIDSALIEGHTVTARGLKTITDVGSVQNGIDFGIFDGDEIVTDNYDIEWRNGEITVTPRKITVGAKSYEKIYDGTPLTSNGVEVVSENGLVEGHSIYAQTAGAIINAGTGYSSITDASTVVILDENGEDIGYNYEVEDITVGTLTVFRREITITAGDAQKVYDGTPLTCDDYDVTSELETPLVEDHILTVKTDGSVTDATSGINSISDYSIMFDEDVTANYKVECVDGVLTVSKRHATVVTPSTDEEHKLVYDGSQQCLEGFEEIPEDNIDTGIVKGHTLQIKDVFYAIDADTYDNAHTFEIIFNGVDVIDNYELSIGYGKLTISPRPIKVTTFDSNKVYDGEALTNTAHKFTNLVAGHEATITVTGTITDAGSIPNTFDKDSLKVTFDGNDVTGNYEIVEDDTLLGKLTVTKRPVTVTTSSNLADEFELIYNAEEQSYLKIASVDNIVQDHKAVADISKDYTTLTDVGEAENKFEVNIYNGEINVTDNYSINYIYGTLTITPLPIKLKTATAEWTFDGESHYDGAVEDVDGKLLDGYGHTLAYVDLPKIKEVSEGEVKNEFEILILNAEGEDITHNYDISADYGKLTIKPLPIIVTANSDEKVYDAKPLTDSGFEVTAEDKYTAQLESVKVKYTFVPTVTGSITDVGEEDNKVSNLKVYDGETEVNLKNFVVTYVNGKLTVTPRPITVTAGSATKVYDGEELTCKTFEITEGSLADGQTLTVVITTSEIYAGTYDNVIDSYKITDKVVGKVTHNYEVTTEKGALTINKRPVTITTASNGKDNIIYSGEEQSYEVYEVEQKDVDRGILSGHTASIKVAFKAIDAGEYENAHTFEITDGTDDVTDNYEINVVKGTLTISKRLITVTTGSDEKVYDGEALTKTTPDFTNLVAGHEATITVTGTITDVGSTSNTFDESSLKVTSDGKDVTKNYEIESSTLGTLTVTERPIYVYALDCKKVYDGTTDIPDEIKRLDSAHRYDGKLFGIVVGHKIYADIVGVEKEIGADVGTYSIKITDDKDKIFIKDGNGKDVTSNYDVTPLVPPIGPAATLTVTKRPITVTAGSVTETYDGKAHTCESWNITKGSLADGQDLTVVITTSKTDAGTYDNLIDSYIITDKAVGDVTHNYEVTTEKGTLQIDKRPITVITSDGNKFYDGQPLTNTTPAFTNLVKDHKATITVTGTITEIGSTPNTFDKDSLKVTCGENDVTKNYEIESSTLGTLTVKGKLTIKTADATREYDGKPLTANTIEDYTITEGTLPDGFTLKVDISGSQTEVGWSLNTFDWQILKGQDDMSKYFEVKKEEGTLTVTKRSITITTGSAQKIYDGTPLKYEKWEITDGSLVEGHFAAISGFSERTEPGSEPNEFTDIDIHDKNGYSVLENYKVTKNYGTLTVTEDTEIPDSDMVWIRAMSETGGYVYLRQYSVGDYLSGMVWSNATPYEKTISYNGGEYGYNYLTSIALGDSVETKKVEIQLTSMMGSYLLPYYASADGGHTIQTTDTVYSGNTVQYSVNYAKYDYLTSGKLNLPSEYAEEEAQYSKFVKENYLTVDDVTRSFLDGVIKENHLSKDDIAGVAEYIKSTASYGLGKDYSQLESSENVIISFLRDAEYGVCRHFAMAATMLYRALGIPARYTVGFAGNLIAGEWIDFKEGHAWVELYIDGLGWVMVEVTPPLDDNGGGEGEGGGEGGNGPHTYTVTLRPRDAVKTYDGTEVTATEILPDLTLVRLKELGYTYKVAFEGSQTEIGESESVVTSFTLYTPEGKVFTDVGYIYKKGLLKVVEEEVVTVHTYVKNKQYDGEPMYFDSDEYYATFASDLTGYTVKVSGLESVGFTEPGILTPEQLKVGIAVTVYDEQGTDVTALFYIDYDPDFMITRIAVTIATHNVSMEYDGDELVDDSDPQITFGSLMAGHKIKVTSRPSLTEPGEIPNAIVYIIVDEDGKDVSAYYDITKVYGKLTVTEGD